MAERTDRTISLHLRQAPDNAEAGSLAALVLLQRKGRALDAMTDAFAAVRRRIATIGRTATVRQLNTTTAELARVGTERASESAESARARHRLDAKKERLEAELSEHSAEFRAEMLPVTLAAVQAAIPDEPRCWSSRCSGRSIRGPSGTPKPMVRRITPPTSCAGTTRRPASTSATRSDRREVGRLPRGVRDRSAPT